MFPLWSIGACAHGHYAMTAMHRLEIFRSAEKSCSPVRSPVKFSIHVTTPPVCPTTLGGLPGYRVQCRHLITGAETLVAWRCIDSKLDCRFCREDSKLGPSNGVVFCIALGVFLVYHWCKLACEKIPASCGIFRTRACAHDRSVGPRGLADTVYCSSPLRAVQAATDP